MESPKQPLISERAQLLAGATLLEFFAAGSAYETLQVIEAGGENTSFRTIVGAIGTAAMAASGAFMWKKFHELRDKAQ